MKRFDIDWDGRMIDPHETGAYCLVDHCQAEIAALQQRIAALEDEDKIAELEEENVSLRNKLMAAEEHIETLQQWQPVVDGFEYSDNDPDAPVRLNFYADKCLQLTDEKYSDEFGNLSLQVFLPDDLRLCRLVPAAA